MEYFDRYYVRYESEYLEHDVEGKFMLYDDHVAVVEKLKAEIISLQAEASESQNNLEAAYNNGYDDGRWAGYHELSQDFGVVDKEELTK